MLKALYQLNSEPVVLLKKIEKCVKNKLPDCTANVDRDAMQRYQIVKKSPDPRDHSSSSLNLKINLTGGVPTCLKRKASLEDAFTEADAVYETHKKIKKDESVDSDNSKKKSKNHQAEVKLELEKKTKGSETSDKEKGKANKKLAKEKVKCSKSEIGSEKRASAKSEHHSETGSGLSSSELQTKHSQKKDRKHERKKKKSKERSKDSSKSPLNISTPESKKQSCTGEEIDGSEETVALEKDGEVSVPILKPTSADEVATDEEVFEESKDTIDAPVEDEHNCDLPRSDSAATVALDIDMDRQSVGSSTDDVEPEFVNLVSPDKPNTLLENTIPLNDNAESEMEVTLERSPEIGSSHEVCEKEQAEDTKQSKESESTLPIDDKIKRTISISSHSSQPQNDVEDISSPASINQENDDAQSPSVDDSSLTETTNVISLKTSKSEAESLQNSEADGSTQMHVEKPENDLIDSLEDQPETIPLERLKESGICSSPAVSEQGVEADPQATTASSLSPSNLETEPDVMLPVIVDKDNEDTSHETFTPVKKMCCISIDVPTEQLEQQESHIRLEKIEIQTALSEIIAERKTLGKELRLLLFKSKELEQELTVKNVSISADVRLVETLSDAVNVAREERNRLAAEKKKTHHMVLQTEIKLRELQVLLIRQQLDLGDTKLVESHPLFNDMSENERLVADLTEQVADKSTTHKETEAIHQKAEILFRQKNEEHEILVKRLEEARQMHQELSGYLNEMNSEIESIKSKLNELADNLKRKCLRAVDIEEESIKIESCKKIKEIEVKRQKIAAIDDDMEFEYLIPKLCQLLPTKILEEGKKEKEETASITATLPQLENSAISNLRSPDSGQSPHQFAQQLPITVPPVTVAESLSNLLTEGTGSTYHIIETVAVSSEVTSPVVVENQPFSPQTQPICLRIPSTSVDGLSPTLSNVTSTTLGSPSIIQSTPSSNPIALRVVENLTNPEPMQASTSQNITPASFALSPHPISLKSLSEAYPFYAQFLNPNSSTANSDDEGILYQEIVNGCRQFTNWKCSYSCSKDLSNIARDNPLLRQSAGYMKDYLIPFYRLMLKKNTTAAQLFDSIIQQAQKANWYGMPAVDSTFMKQMLENNLRSAIDIGTKFKDQSAILPSRVEFSPSSGKSSMPTFTIHLATPEAFRSPTLASHMQTSAKNSIDRSPADRTQVNTVTQGDHSPIGALSTMITNQVRQVNQQAPGSAQHSPNTIAVEGHPGMPRQGWTSNSVNNGMVVYQQQQVVQNTAVVVPMMNAQYTGRHRMPAVQQTVPPPHSTWPQQTAHQAYVQTLQANRMQTPVNYQAGPYRQQQQATLQHQYMHPNGSQQTLSSSQQLHQRLAVPIAGDSPSRQNMSILGSHLQQAQTPVQQQRIRQQTASQQLPNQPTVSHHLSGMQQQQAPHSQAHSLQSTQHQIMQQQRHMPMSSPPINAQSQRHFSGQQSDIARQPAMRRLSRDVSQPQQHPLYTCLKCGQEAQQKCSGCQTTFYCSRDCQVAHWDEHGKTCSKQV